MDSTTKAASKDQLKKIQESRQFSRSPRSKKFLEHIVTETLEGREEGLKGFSIAQEVFGKGDDFDPKDNSVVSEAGGALREKLTKYYADEGRADRWVINIPVGKFIPEFHLRTEIEATPTGRNPTPKVEERDGRSRRMWIVALGAVAVAILVWVLLSRSGNTEFRITSPLNGGVVGPKEEVTGTGWDPGLNHYLIVEPLDKSGRRWAWGKIESRQWTRGVEFGQADTPSGMQFRIYVLSTKSELPKDEVKQEPENPRASPAITVILQK